MSGTTTTVPRLSAVLSPFLEYAQAELQFSAQSLIKYEDCARQIQKIMGDRPMDSYAKEDVLSLKAILLSRQLSVSRQVSILSAFKRILGYCRGEGIEVLDPDCITVPRRPRREVAYLTVEEVERFVASIPLTTLKDKPHLAGLRFRALVEVLLGTAMRIGEVLSLDRDRIDFKAREARIIGKGNKERTVFFTARSLYWLGKYLETRTDKTAAVFVIEDGTARLKRPDIWRPFRRYRVIAGINKRVTPHLLRHTAATQLLFNGCPVGHIKEILGHERLETTCRYYLGLDHRAAKLAHEKYLIYDVAASRTM
ncbi:MAG TPA: tyrosine-type recombinase/integrase [Bryobacteraceae bacterium]|nr:tyrosine-type recombinase/integrase [Bryobacteraceae bacterium]